MSFSKVNRRFHKWLGVIIAVPLLVIFLTGILLLVKKEFSFIQPTSMTGSTTAPSISFERVLSIAKTVKHADIDNWQDINRLDVRPNKGIIKIRSHNRVEIQIDAASGEILHVATRHSELIESIHDGTFFEENANLWLMLPVTLMSTILLFSGVIMFFIPYLKKRRKRKLTVN